MTMELTAEGFVGALHALQSDAERDKNRRHVKADTEVLGVRMKHVFDTAKAFAAMPLDEVERLLDSPFYEARLGAVSILDFRARRRGLSDADRQALYELYLRRHDRIDNWDLVDRAAPRVVGWYLLDRPRDVLDRLARSPDPLERRTAIVATYFLIRNGQVDDALRIAEMLVGDDSELVTKPVGTALREVGTIDEARLVAFLETHGATMPRTALRMATEKLDPAVRRSLLAG